MKEIVLPKEVKNFLINGTDSMNFFKPIDILPVKDFSVKNFKFCSSTIVSI